ncbi:MAG: tetratricopeptide repeat protein [Bacteroidales bacterium]
MTRCGRYRILWLIGVLLTLSSRQPLVAQEENKTITGTQIYAPYDPNAPSAKANNLQLGLQYYRDQDYEKSAAVFRSLYENDANHTHYTYYLYSLIGIKEFKEAEKLAKRQRRANPQNHRYAIDLGYLYVTLGEVQKGHKIYREAIESLPARRQDIVNLANAFIGKRETDLALETFQRGIALMQGTDNFENELASLYYTTQQYDQMAEAYLSLAANDPSKTSFVQNRLQYYLGLDREGEIHEALRIALLRKVQSQPDERFFSDFLLWFSLQEKDYSTALRQAIALDKRFDSNGNMVFNVGTFCLAGKEFTVAMEAFSYIRKHYPDDPIYAASLAGYNHALFERFRAAPGPKDEQALQIELSLREAIDELGISSLSLQNVRDLSHLYAFYRGKSNQARELLEKALTERLIKPAEKQEVKLDLADLFLFIGDPWEATLLLSQVEKSNKNEPIGHEAKFRNAKLSYYIGEYGWAEAQLDILKGATSKLIANDAMNLYLFIKDNKDNDSLSPALKVFSRAELLAFRRQYDAALHLLDSLAQNNRTHSIADDNLYKQAEIYEKTGDFARADSLYQQVYTRFPKSILADDALMRQITLQKLPQAQEKVNALYEKILFEYPGSIFAVEVRENYRSAIDAQKENSTIPLPEIKK